MAIEIKHDPYVRSLIIVDGDVVRILPPTDSVTYGNPAVTEQSEGLWIGGISGRKLFGNAYDVQEGVYTYKTKIEPFFGITDIDVSDDLPYVSSGSTNANERIRPARYYKYAISTIYDGVQESMLSREFEVIQTDKNQADFGELLDISEKIAKLNISFDITATFNFRITGLKVYRSGMIGGVWEDFYCVGNFDLTTSRAGAYDRTHVLLGQTLAIGNQSSDQTIYLDYFENFPSYTINGGWGGIIPTGSGSTFTTSNYLFYIAFGRTQNEAWGLSNTGFGNNANKLRVTGMYINSTTNTAYFTSTDSIKDTFGSEPDALFDMYFSGYMQSLVGTSITELQVFRGQGSFGGEHVAIAYNVPTDDSFSRVYNKQYVTESPDHQALFVTKARTGSLKQPQLFSEQTTNSHTQDLAKNIVYTTLEPKPQFNDSIMQANNILDGLLIQNVTNTEHFLANFFDVGEIKLERYPLQNVVSIDTIGRFGIMHQNRLILGYITLDYYDKKEKHNDWIAFSEEFSPDVIPVSNVIPLPDDAGTEITGLLSLNDTIIVFKRESIFFINTSNQDPALWRITESKTSIGHHSVYKPIKVRDAIYFVYGDGIYELTSSALSGDTSKSSIRKISENIDDSLKTFYKNTDKLTKVRLLYDNKENSLMCWIPYDNELVLSPSGTTLGLAYRFWTFLLNEREWTKQGLYYGILFGSTEDDGSAQLYTQYNQKLYKHDTANELLPTNSEFTSNYITLDENRKTNVRELVVRHKSSAPIGVQLIDENDNLILDTTLTESNNKWINERVNVRKRAKNIKIKISSLSSGYVGEIGRLTLEYD